MATIINLQEHLEQKESKSNQLLSLTEQQVRAYPEFINAIDEEVLHIINTLHQLSLITYEVFANDLQEYPLLTKVA